MRTTDDFDRAASDHDARLEARAPWNDTLDYPEPIRCEGIDCDAEVSEKGFCTVCQADIDAHTINEPNPTTMNPDDNFDNLWSNLKEQVKAARGYNGAVTTMGSLTAENSLRVSLSPPSKHFNTDAPWVHMSISGASITAKARGGELLAISALCIAAALDLEEQATPKP